uniref:Vacuolar iron transporter n=1 Tax=Ananas comosus var. bracteatus TaxID=296719 RepID=A0A6V7NHE6_ANACO|nr:unnamed protein product [Ananas comosus var. bracteatus]
MARASKPKSHHPRRRARLLEAGAVAPRRGPRRQRRPRLDGFADNGRRRRKRRGARAMLVAGFAGLVAGACSMAIGEFVSVYSQLDTEIAQLNRAEGRKDATVGQAAVGDMRQLPSPVQAAVASALAFSVGGAVPLLAAGFITSYKVRMMVVAAAVTVALLGFGIAGAVLGRAPVGRSCVRVVVGGWLAMAITFGLMKLFAFTGL